MWIFVDGNPFFGLIYNFKITLKTAIFQKCGYARNDTFGHGNLNLRPLYNRYFCHITTLKWSQICQNFIKKCFLGDILFFGKFSIQFPIIAVKLYQHRK